MNYYIYLLFIPMMMISNFMILISNSWISFWMIMEISLISIIMMMIFDKLMKPELIMMYYLFQSFNSYLFLINSLGLFIETTSFICLMIMNFSILMKLSIVPFHYWYLKIMCNLNWMNIYFFSIINKMIPLYIINNILNLKYSMILKVNFFLLIYSSFISSIIGLNQIKLKLIFSYSSMIQLSWIIILLKFNEMISIMYFIIYNFISMMIFMMMFLLNFNSLNQINYMKVFNNKMFLFFMLMIFSLSGLPPFFGFLMKWISIQLFTQNNLNFFFMFIFIMNSLISMYFYFRLMYLSMLNYYIMNKNNLKYLMFYQKFNKKLIMLNWFILILLFLYQIM